jgi:glycosyltransferase involved in cell wall biosynthesis
MKKTMGGVRPFSRSDLVSFATMPTLVYLRDRLFFPDTAGGLSLSNVTLFRELVKRGWNVHVICHRALWSRQSFAEQRRRSDSWFFQCAHAEGRTMWRLRFPQLLRRAHRAALFYRLALHLKPSLVLGDSNINDDVLSALARKRIPSLFIARNIPPPGCAERAEPALSIAANSPPLGRHLEGLLCREVPVIRPFIDPSMYVSERREPRYVTFVNPVYEKGLTVAMEIARRLPDVSFLFVNGRWPRARREASWLFQKSHFTRNITVWPFQADMRRVYAVTRILLLPSQWYETFGRVISEANMNGIPVIASDTGGVAATVGRGGLIVSPPTNVAGYVKAIRTVLDDRGVHDRLRDDALANARAETFDLSRQIDLFEASADCLMAAGGQRPARNAP